MSKKITRKEFLKSSAASLVGATLAGKNTAAAALEDNPIVRENAKQGAPDWELADPAYNREIEGYASKTSVARGSTISFYVSTTAKTYNIEFFRLGWYNGAGARRMTSPVSRVGIRQTMPKTDPVTGLIECNWTSPYTINIPNTADPTNWASGYYLAKLTARGGKDWYIPFVVRDDPRASKYLFQSSVTTYQAYNAWGGKSLYPFNSTNSARAYKVSFNRPYDNGYGTGDLVNDWSGWELNMLRFLEREGYDLTYCTNLDTHENPNLINNRKSFLSVGHDEYWSREIRDNVENARNRGVHLGFFTANAAYWQVRFEPSSVNGAANRTLVCYKEAAKDPFYSDPNKRQLTTVTWRDPIVNRPEEPLLGVQYEHYPVDADMVIANASHWVFANTGLRNGDKLPGLVGYEADRRFGIGPANTVVLAHSPVVSEVGAGYSDMTLYTHASGANVFATGSIQWAWGLDDYFAWWSHTYLVHAGAQQITRNVLNRFGQ